MRNIEADKISGRYRMLFEEVRKDLNDVLNQYKFNKTATNLNDLKLKLATTMDWHKDKMYKIRKSFPINPKRFDQMLKDIGRKKL